jgi:hypothetical protein
MAVFSVTGGEDTLDPCLIFLRHDNISMLRRFVSFTAAPHQVRIIGGQWRRTDRKSVV